jgi:peptide/nickel transport system permease protein
VGRDVVDFGTIIVNATFQVADAVCWWSRCPTWASASARRRPAGVACSAQGCRASTSATGGRSTRAGILIILVVIAINFIGDALRDSFEVRLQRR